MGFTTTPIDISPSPVPSDEVRRHKPVPLCRFDDFGQAMTMLPNCPQSDSLCHMRDGGRCAPIPKCDGCPKAHTFLGTLRYEHNEPCLKKRDDIRYNFYATPHGECFTQAP